MLNDWIDAQLRGGLHQAGLRLPHGREGLIEIVGHLGQIVARVRLRRQTERDANLIDSLQRLFTLRFRDQQGLLAQIKLLLRQRLRCDQRLGAVEIGLCSVERGLVAIRAWRLRVAASRS